MYNSSPPSHVSQSGFVQYEPEVPVPGHEPRSVVPLTVWRSSDVLTTALEGGRGLAKCPVGGRPHLRMQWMPN